MSKEVSQAVARAFRNEQDRFQPQRAQSLPSTQMETDLHFALRAVTEQRALMGRVRDMLESVLAEERGAEYRAPEDVRTAYKAIQWYLKEVEAADRDEENV